MSRKDQIERLAKDEGPIRRQDVAEALDLSEAYVGTILADLAKETPPHLSEEDVPFKPLRKAPSEIDLYTLRHSCCTHWLRERRRLVWVNRLMRHESIETTMGYVHLLPSDLRSMYEAGAS
mgnify:CR=1 FL=1